MKTIVNLTAYILILLGLYSCNDDVFVDDFRTSDTEFTLDGNGDEVTIRFASSNWDLVWMYTYDSDFTHQYEVYDADDNLIMRNQDAYLKGFKGFDAEEAYQAVKASATVSHFNSDWETFEKYGYFPFDIIDTESVSKTLECAYDDYCVAQMAKALGKTEDYEHFSKRAAFYKNLFDPELKLMRGKDSKGNWRTPFNSFLLSHASSSGGDFTEGNSWQYTWHVQHDVQGLIDLMGGNEAFVTKLDSLFFLESTAENTGFVSDVTGLIGQYAHGNEPSHHVAYLYSYAGHPEKTQQVIREVFDRFYLAKPDGLCGNDDCGQMSAWYIFSAMGFYPVNPISGEYVLGAPQIEKISLSLPEGKTFTVEAKGLSKANKYVKSVELNGKPVTGLTISHKDIMNGGNLVFTMTDQPRR